MAYLKIVSVGPAVLFSALTKSVTPLTRMQNGNKAVFFLPKAVTVGSYTLAEHGFKPRVTNGEEELI